MTSNIPKRRQQRQQQATTSINNVGQTMKWLSSEATRSLDAKFVIAW
jgi:hypothetical protein